MDSRTLRQLNQIDWDFVDGHDSYASGVHWYPGTFVPGIPGNLIEALSSPNDWVLDPYCGIGTTGIAALVRSRNVLVTDINPIALISSYCGLALVYLRLTDSNAFNLAFGILEEFVHTQSGARLLNLDHSASARQLDEKLKFATSTDLSSDFGISLDRDANVADLSTWYEERTLADICSFLTHARQSYGEGIIYLLCICMISSIARNLSSQTKSWGHLADNVRPKEFVNKNLYVNALNWIKKTKNRYKKIPSSEKMTNTHGRFEVRYADWTKNSEKIDIGFPIQLLVTSPPYAGAIDYILAQRLSLYILGLSELEIYSRLETEMGARRKRSKSLHKTTWAELLKKATENQMNYIVDGGYSSFVMPHKDSGREMGEEAIKKTFAEAGWKNNFVRDRSIRQARARQSWTSIKMETVYIFEKPT